METLGDFLKLLLVALEKKRIAYSMRNRRPWHQMLYILKTSKAAGKPRFLDDVWFDWNDDYPRSPELDEFLQGYVYTGTVATTSPRFEEWHLSQEHIKLWEKMPNDLTQNDQQFLNLAVALTEDEFKRAGIRTSVA